MRAHPLPDRVARLPFAAPMPPILGRIDCRPAIGAPFFTGADEAVTGGWMRMDGDHAPDAPALALYADAWFPAVFPRLEALVPCPTIDLTIHFRRRSAAAGGFVLGRFSSRTSADGLFEEDGELWGEDGVLLAQSRQLAILRPLRA